SVPSHFFGNPSGASSLTISIGESSHPSSSIYTPMVTLGLRREFAGSSSSSTMLATRLIVFGGPLWRPIITSHATHFSELPDEPWEQPPEGLRVWKNIFSEKPLHTTYR